MRLALAVAIAGWGGTGCKTADDFPVLPGGGGVPGHTNNNESPADAPDDSIDGTAKLAGRVCLFADLRAPTSACASTGAQDLVVTLGSKTTTTDDDGTFSIDVPASSNLVWRVSGPSLVTSAMPFAADFVIPAVTSDDYAALLSANIGFPSLISGQGSLVVRVVSAVAPLANAVATQVVPGAQFATRYDGTSATVWDQDATGESGVVWVIGAMAAPISVKLTPMAGNFITTPTVVEDQTITFITVEFP